MKEWDYDSNININPNKIAPHSSKKYFWRCILNHKWAGRVSDRTRGNGCPFCSIPCRLILVGFNDLQTKNPELAKEWHPILNGKLTPLDVMPFTNKKVHWLGKCGHNWQASPAHRSNGRGCPYCTRNPKVLSGFNDLKTKNPSYLTEWDYSTNGILTPEMFTINSGKKVAWICGVCSRKWRASPNARTNGKTSCPSKKCIQNKTKQTFRENYGCDFAISSDIVKNKFKNTMMERYGAENPSQVPEIASRIARRFANFSEVPYWKTKEPVPCQAGYEPKVVNMWNLQQKEFNWQIIFRIPKDEPLIGGRTYRIDYYLIDENKYIEVKGIFRGKKINGIPISKLKWEWFHRTYPNSELWDEHKLKSLGLKV